MLKIYNLKDKQEYIKEIAILTQRKLQRKRVFKNTEQCNFERSQKKKYRKIIFENRIRKLL